MPRLLISEQTLLNLADIFLDLRMPLSGETKELAELVDVEILSTLSLKLLDQLRTWTKFPSLMNSPPVLLHIIGNE